MKGKGKIRIVLVEDDPRLAERLSAIVRRSERYRVAESFGCLRDAMAGWSQCQADVMLVDLGLPDGDGVQLIREVAAARPDMRVLVFSAHSDERGVLQSLRAGAHGYLLKDSAEPHLLESLDQLMDGGAPLTPSVAVCVLKYLKQPGALEAAAARQNPLTERETEVLTHIAHGLSNAEIGDCLNVTINTVRAHTKSIFRKLSVHSRAAAIYRAVDDGYIRM